MLSSIIYHFLTGIAHTGTFNFGSIFIDPNYLSYLKVDAVNILPLELIRGLHNIKPHHRGNVVTIGSFDGVHLGHQAIIRQVTAQAQRLQLPSMAMIFEPQPHEFFCGGKAPGRLMRLREKMPALAAAGIDRLCCLKFDRYLSELSAPAFIERVLVQRLGVRHLVVGDDFRFGCDRNGDYNLLLAAGARSGFTVSHTQTYIIDAERVSSTRVRRLLTNGQFSLAAALLGRPYTMSGRVVRGQQLGRRLGWPTANVHLYRYRSPLQGVFAVTVSLPSQEKVFGVANVGVRPTLGSDHKPLLEVHLLDRSDDLYGSTIVVEFKHKLREEQRFDDLKQLTAQVQRDIQAARDYFSRQPFQRI